MCICGKHANRKDDSEEIGKYWKESRGIESVKISISEEDRISWLERAVEFLNRSEAKIRLANKH